MLDWLIKSWSEVDHHALAISFIFFVLGIGATYVLPRREVVTYWIGEKRDKVRISRLNSRAKRKYYAIRDYAKLCSSPSHYYRWELDNIYNVVLLVAAIVVFNQFLILSFFTPLIAGWLAGFAVFEVLQRRRIKLYFSDPDKLFFDITYVANNLGSLDEYEAALLLAAAGMQPERGYSRVFTIENYGNGINKLTSAIDDADTFATFIKTLPEYLQKAIYAEADDPENKTNPSSASGTHKQQLISGSEQDASH